MKPMILYLWLLLQVPRKEPTPVVLILKSWDEHSIAAWLRA